MASQRASTASFATNVSASNGSARVPRQRSSSKLGGSTTMRCVHIRASATLRQTSSWLTKQTQRLARQRAGSLRYWGLRAPARCTNRPARGKCSNQGRPSQANRGPKKLGRSTEAVGSIVVLQFTYVAVSLTHHLVHSRRLIPRAQAAISEQLGAELETPRSL